MIEASNGNVYCERCLKHLTKAEIEARKNAEVTAPCDKVRPPSYLTPEQKKQFRKIAKELLEIKLISNLDCDALARLLIAQTQYIEITEQIRETPLMEDVPVYETRENPDTGEKERVQVGTRQVVNGERLQRQTFDLGTLHDELRDPIQGRIGHAPIRIVARRKNEP